MRSRSTPLVAESTKEIGARKKWVMKNPMKCGRLCGLENVYVSKAMYAVQSKAKMRYVINSFYLFCSTSIRKCPSAYCAGALVDPLRIELRSG